MRRLLALVILFAALAPQAAAQDEGVEARLDLEVEEDRSESMTLTFDGLRRLTQYNGICLPARARETRVYDELGDVAYDVKEEDGRRVVTFIARVETTRIDMRRPAPAPETDPLFTNDVNFCVPQGARVRVDVRVPADHTLFFLSEGAIASGRSGTTSSDGPAHVFYSYEAPLLGRQPLVIFDEGPFRVYVTPALADQAREVARLAADPFEASLAEAGLVLPFDRMRAIYSRDTPYDWEAGHYNGYGFVQVKESTLAPDPTEGFPYAAVKVLVHEGFHGASFPHGQGQVGQTIAWWLEGTARHAERHVDRAMPNATMHCERSVAEIQCWSFDDRIDRANLSTAYAPSFSFQTAWEPSAAQDETTRRFYYGLSEFVVGAWIAQHGEARYRAVWAQVQAAFNDGEGCPCAEGWIEGLLGDEDLYRPWDDVRARDPAGFEARIAPLVKDEAALERRLDEESPLGGFEVPLAPALALVAALVAALTARRRR